jgi:hypothetical protein
VLVKGNGPIVFGMNGERTHAYHIRNLKGTPKRIKQETGTNAAALRVRVDGKAREYQQGNWVTGHALDDALRGLRVLNLTGNDRIETNDLIAVQCNVSLR